MLLVPEASVNVPAATSIVVAPSDEGVNVAVYVVPLPENELNVPLVTVTSAAAKVVVASLEVKVSAIEESPDVSPSLTVLLVIVIVGAVVSTLKLDDVTCVAAFPAASLTSAVMV